MGIAGADSGLTKWGGGGAPKVRANPQPVSAAGAKPRIWDLGLPQGNVKIQQDICDFLALQEKKSSLPEK